MGQHLPLSPRAGGDGMREATLFYCLYIVGSPCRPAAVLFTRVTVYVNDSLVLRENLGMRGVLTEEAFCQVSVYLKKMETVSKVLSWLLRESKLSWLRATSAFTAVTWWEWG